MPWKKESHACSKERHAIVVSPRVTRGYTLLIFARKATFSEEIGLDIPMKGVTMPLAFLAWPKLREELERVHVFR